MVDELERDALLGVHGRNAAIAGEGVVGLRLCREVHELEADVDHVAASGIAIGGLDIDAHDHARDGSVHVGDVQVLAAGAGDGRHLGVGTALHRGDSVNKVGVGKPAREGRGGRVAEPFGTDAVTHVSVAVDEREHEVEAERLLASGRRAPGVHQGLDGVFVLHALRLQRRLIGDEAREDERARKVNCLAEFHGVAFYATKKAATAWGRAAFKASRCGGANLRPIGLLGGKHAAIAPRGRLRLLAVPITDGAVADALVVTLNP